MKRKRDAGLPSIAVLKAAYRAGTPCVEQNIPVAYRDLGNMRRAFFWWKKLSDNGDGDASVDAGYCFQYGIGVKQNKIAAQLLYRRAIKSTLITEAGREEAMYFLAVSLVDSSTSTRSKKRAIELLRTANRNNDYVEADALLKQLLSGSKNIEACRCRRGLWKHIKGQAKCLIHPRK
jgi:hypothetical protein